MGRQEGVGHFIWINVRSRKGSLIINHASLSFDSDLQTIISYNDGQNVYLLGLNHEIEERFNNKADSSIMVY